MDEKMTLKTITACFIKSYAFCLWPELAPTVPIRSQLARIGPNWPVSFRFVPFWFRFDSGRFVPYVSVLVWLGELVDIFYS